ncbi:MAG: penicillin acylase family protein [Candidatus Eremiobacteraeota bacterium]|nr:penicillin acylase family protein [Candidatus Eremiobacteraeota bacterium]
MIVIVRRAIALVAILIGVSIAAFVANVVSGLHSVSPVTGTVTGLAVSAPVHIRRDARGVPHILASNQHDLFFAQGYVEGSDRLFQLDLLRRFVYGDLSEILGNSLLSTDEGARVVPVSQLVARQWAKLAPRDRSILQAFADGVNAAMERQPAPVEFRALMYSAKPWRPQDSLAVGFATVLDLTDSWDDVGARDGKRIPLTDPCYDAPVTEGLIHIADPSQCRSKIAYLVREFVHSKPPLGSNEWAAGNAHTTTGRALLANDPHLRLQIPGVWYLVDLESPGYHAAGATLAGTPGVILGHNDRIAWGATNGSVAALSVFRVPPHLDESGWKSETFHARFGKDTIERYYRTGSLFGATVRGRFVLVRWSAYGDPKSPLLAFDSLDRARSIEDGLRALRAYPGPTQNFVIAQTDGRVAYTLAGEVPSDPTWATSIHPASDLPKQYPAIPFGELPHVDASRNAVVWTSNNKMYGPRYRYRLSAQFSPPYRAYRVAALLRARSRYDVAYFTAMQMDTYSIPERELARYFRSLRRWDGHFSPDSREATAAYALRQELIKTRGGIVSGILAARSAPGIIATLTLPASPQPWGTAGAVTVKHPLATLGLGFLNGTTFAGNGDAYTVHVQNSGFSQSFRAVWDVGNWDAGGITIPQGESGQPGSTHYTDEAADWNAGRLLGLPFSEESVKRATIEVQTLEP